MINNLLSFSSVMSTIGSVIVAILILLLTITVHEFGHYIVGKIFKFKINEFAIGMGPAIYKKVKKNGEIFSIRIFPLGGFCAFEGEDQDETTVSNSVETAAEDKSENDEKPQNSAINEDSSSENASNEQSDDFFDVKKDENVKVLSKNAFNNKKPWQRILVLVAGASVNFIFAVLLIIMNFAIYGHFSFEAYEVKKGTAATYEEFSLQDGDVMTKVNGKYLYMSLDLIDALDGKKKGDMVDVEVVDKSGKKAQRKVMLTSDVNPEGLTDYICCFKALGIATVPYIKPDSGSKLKDGEYLFRINDKNAPNGEDALYYECTRIYDAESLRACLSGYNEGDTVGFWMSSSDENAIGGKQLVNVTLTDWTAVDKNDAKAVMAYLGVDINTEISSETELMYSYQVYSKNVRLSFTELLYRPMIYSFKTVGQTFRAFGGLFNGSVSITDVSGPVSTITLTSEYVKYGFNYVLEIASLIGISVAIFNLLPIPALDGARAVFVAIEWIRKKPINRKVEGMIHAVGLIALLIFAVAVDVAKLFI